MQELGIRMMEYGGYELSAICREGVFAGCCLLKGEDVRALWLLDEYQRPQGESSKCGMFLSCSPKLILPKDLRMEMDFTLE